jgi:DNA-binding Lrp family transcriptional regulator
MRELDRIDAHMIELLRADGRKSVNALAEAVGVSRANAYRRLERLQETGVIRGFTVRVDPARVGRPLTAIILIGVEQKRWASIKDTLTGLSVEGVEYLAATTGEFDFLALIRIPDMATLRDVVLKKLHSTPGVVSTRTVFVLDEVLQP